MTPVTNAPMVAPGFRVTEVLYGTNDRHPDYPLLPGDLLSKSEDGSLFKVAPGLGIGGFRLDDREWSTLESVDLAGRGRPNRRGGAVNISPPSTDLRQPKGGITVASFLRALDLIFREPQRRALNEAIKRDLEHGR
jgi:hypothetical protein